MQTILLNDDEKENIITEDMHPGSYFQTKIQQLNNLQQQIEIQNSFVTGIQNSNLSMLLNIYNDHKTRNELQEKNKQKYLNPNQFDSIFNDDNVYINKEEQEQKKNELAKKQYFEEYIVKPQLELNEEEKRKYALFTVIEKEKKKEETKHLLHIKKQWLDQLRKEVSEIKKNSDNIVKKTKNSFNCQNMELIRVLAPTIYNSFSVYFDDIFDLFIDELLNDEVDNLNEIEIKKQKKPTDKLFLGIEEEQFQFDESPDHEIRRKIYEKVEGKRIPLQVANTINILDEYAEDDEEY